ncbi:MAG: hypothetical protein QOD72_3611 [Acidimicrobiaceae bacterium]|jgi:uncharacterized circularly permuted ATP-grasp superfamily protein/uncharacterized alpha-E superfamily protein|nr:hypothetical protein [Acidimicrobiaceae bacterium]
MAPPPSTYSTERGCYDDLVDDTGHVRPRWEALAALLGDGGRDDLNRLRVRADRLIVAEGANHVAHDDASDSSRPWRLDPIPVLVDGREWAALERSLLQRARLLEAVLADLYGPQRLLHEGVIPAAVVLGHRGYLRACAGVTPVSGNRMTVYGADIVRESTGRFVVLRDVTDAPSGAGYALLNRSILARLLPEQYRNLRVARLADHLALLRDALAHLAPPQRRNPRMVVLTTGVGHPSYVEHSYLATQLGYHLAEGVDLTVRDGRVWLRALDGLEPVDVMLRRAHDLEADPLALEASGRRGVAGLLQVAREGNVGLANALGSGVAGHLALQPYLPGACRALLDEELQLPSLDTFWCGDPHQRAVVLGEFDDMVLHDTDPVAPRPSAFGAELTGAARDEWIGALDRTPGRVAAQRRVRFATTPVFEDGTLRPGAVSLRVHAVLGEESTVLPGALARIASPHVPVLGQRTGTSKDVWVLPLADAPTSIGARRAVAVPQVDLRTSLPSRAAEALYWVGRNAEHAEAAARVASVLVSRFEQAQPDDDASGWLAPLVAGLRAVSGGADVAAPAADDLLTLVRRELAGSLAGRPGAVADSLGHLQGSAASVREYLSTSTWRVVGLLDSERITLTAGAGKNDLFVVTESLDRTIVALAGFAGLTMESVVRGPGWRFLDIGRRLERARMLLGFLSATLAEVPDAAAEQPLLDATLSACESLVAFRRTHRSDLALDAVVDMLVADDTNPRSLVFQLDRITDDLAALPDREARREQQATVRRAAERLIDDDWRDGLDGRPGHPLLGLGAMVLDVRAALFEFSACLVDTWFSHVGDVQRVRRSRP